MWVKVERIHTKKCRNMEVFITDWIRRFTPYVSVFSTNTGKYGPEITPYFDTFHALSVLGKIRIYEIKLYNYNRAQNVHIVEFMK